VGGHREPYGPQHSIPFKNDNGILTWPDELILDGPAIMNFSINVVPESVKNLLCFAESKIEDLDYFIFHQANKMINETIRKKLDLPNEKVPSTLFDFGNTSSASIPITLTMEIGGKLNNAPKRILGCGFGVGLSWGSFIADIGDIRCPSLIEF